MFFFAWIVTKKEESFTPENTIQVNGDSIKGGLFWQRFGFGSWGSVLKP